MPTQLFVRCCLSATITLVGLISCASPLDQDYRRVVGLIDNGGIAVDALIVPDTVRASISFSAMVSTFGSSCTRPDGAEVHTTGTLATITPYDSVPPPGAVCTADFRAFPRSVPLTFSHTGSAVVRLYGRGFQGHLTLEDSLIVIP